MYDDAVTGARIADGGSLQGVRPETWRHPFGWSSTHHRWLRQTGRMGASLVTTPPRPSCAIAASAITAAGSDLTVEMTEGFGCRQGHLGGKGTS